MEKKSEDTRPISDKQIRYLKRLIKYLNQRLRKEDIEKCNLLKEKIEIIGIENLKLQEAKEYIATFIEFENLYQEQYVAEAKEIDDDIKIIDFSKYKK